MKKNLLFIFLFIFIVFVKIDAHPWKPKHYVIIDSDGGFDDLRTISLLLASPEIRVLAITTSPGVLNAEDTYAKVNALLKSYYHEGILTGINDASSVKPKNCAPAKNHVWGLGVNNSAFKTHNAVEVVKYVTDHISDKITFVCLGSLNTPVLCMEKIPGFASHLKEIVWSNGEVNPTQSFNYKLDKKSFNKVKNDSVPFIIVDGESGNHDLLFFQADTTLNEYVKTFCRSINPGEGDYSALCFDEKTALFLHFPQYFSQITDKNVTVATQDKVLTDSLLNNLYVKILTGQTKKRNQVLKDIPTDTSFYLPDVQKIVGETIKKYGKDEWQSAVLANEMHRHLGVIATMGVKMGMRAREYFGAGVDEMHIISHAGLKQPLSCMNDGLQLSTGGTLGHGLITVDTTFKPAEIEAEFIYMGRKLIITLKPEIKKEILNELHEYNYLYGLQSNLYWALVRRMALKYWGSLDRHDIFIIKEV